VSQAEAPNRDDWHPSYRELYDYSFAKPDAVVEHPWDHTAFKIRTKIFVILSSPASPQMTVKSHPDELEALLAQPNIERAAYVGRFGWISVRAEGAEALEQAKDLIDTSYELVAGKKRRKT
jgi:predicted DNA-binding protein (MmcQ/YjbR family)